MLTKDDLKEIRVLIREEVRPIIKAEVEPVIRKVIEPLKKDIKVIKGDITKIRRGINMIVALFDENYISLWQRVDKNEEKLGISS